MEPRFTDIVALHSKVEQAPPSKVQTAVRSFNPAMSKQLLLIYLQFFFEPTARTEYLDENDPVCSIHKSIVRESTQGIKSKPKPSSCFAGLPTLLLSLTISFLNQRERSKVSIISLQFMRAAAESIARTHLRITGAFIKREMYKTPERFKAMNKLNTVQTLESHVRFHSRQFRITNRDNVAANLRWILQNNDIACFQGKNTDEELVPLFQSYISNIGTLLLSGIIAERGTEFPSKVQVSTAKRIIFEFSDSPSEVSFLWTNRDLWSDSELEDCILNESTLQHLVLISKVYTRKWQWRQYSSRTFLFPSSATFYPLYWLWNIPSLQSCAMSLLLPSADSTEEALTSLLENSSRVPVAEHIRQQTEFASLDITLHVVVLGNWIYLRDTSGHISGMLSRRWLSFNNDYQALFLCERRPRR